MNTCTSSHRYRAFIGVSLLLLLTLLIAACGIPGGTGGTPTSTPTQGSDSGKTPTPSPTISGDTTPTPESPSVKLGPQSCPAAVKDPSHWDPIIGTTKGVNKVERVSCANIMDTAALQALVTVRFSGTDAKLDVYIFTTITDAHPKQVFKLSGLIKGEASISGYNTVMTAEVDTHSTLNTGKPLTAMTPDLFREFDWSTEEGTLVQTAFPGIFPDLTRYQAEADQVQVNQGRDPWKKDPQQVAKALTKQFFDWSRPATTTVLSGGGPKDVYATVQVQELPPQGGKGTSSGPSVKVTLSRLEGNTQNMWVAIGVEDNSMLTLTSIEPRSLIASPVTLEGVGAAFEAVIGRAVVYDHLYKDIGHARVTGTVGMGTSPYSTNVIYTSSFGTGVQEGIVAVYEANGGISDEIFAAVMVKVMLDPEPGVALGPVPCPDAVSNASYWDSFLPLPHHDAKAQTVSCANLLGRPSIQAVVTAQLIVGGGPTIRSIFVFDRITDAQPKLLFKVERLYKGYAGISNYSTIMTAEVDSNSSINKGKGDADVTVDLFREFKWSEGAGTFVQVAFPGIFPDLTRYEAERDQMAVNGGEDLWKNDAKKVAQTMASKLLKWSNAPTTILSGGGAQDIDATVQVKSPYLGGSGLKVTLSRLEGKAKNMWVVVSVESTGMLTIISPKQHERLTSPVMITGTGGAFESVIGRAFVFDHLYTVIGQAQVIGDIGMGKAAYTTKVNYTSSFRPGTQEGLVTVYAYSQADGSIATAVIEKELLSA
jgi:hypothetical protein